MRETVSSASTDWDIPERTKLLACLQCGADSKLISGGNKRENHS